MGKPCPPGADRVRGRPAGKAVPSRKGYFVRLSLDWAGVGAKARNWRRWLQSLQRQCKARKAPRDQQGMKGTPVPWSSQAAAEEEGDLPSAEHLPHSAGS